MPILWKDKNDRELSIEAAQITNNNRRVTRLLPVSGGLSRLDSPIKQLVTHIDRACCALLRPTITLIVDSKTFYLVVVDGTNILDDASSGYKL